MKSTDLQNALDIIKWRLSEHMACDLSGNMGYCMYCQHCDQADRSCKQPQKQRVKNSYCAKAYKEMKKDTECADLMNKILNETVNENK